MAGGSASVWRLSFSVPKAAEAAFATVLEGLEGALVTGAAGPEVSQLDFYLERDPDRDLVADLLKTAAEAMGIATPVVGIERVEDKDWVAESQKNLPAIHAGRFFIHGSHVKETPPPGAIALLIEANQAFGTGHHETTRGCLLALQAFAPDLAVKKALDMGCGSGVLTLAMAHLWPAAVILGVDNDAPSITVARENAQINEAPGTSRFLVGEGYAAPEVADQGPFDLIAANILAEPLITMAHDLARHLKPGGRAVLSGLLDSQAAAVIAAHLVQGLTLLRQEKAGPWVVLLLEKSGKIE